MAGRTTRLHELGEQEELNMSQTVCLTGNTMHATITNAEDTEDTGLSMGAVLVMMNGTRCV